MSFWVWDVYIWLIWLKVGLMKSYIFVVFWDFIDMKKLIEVDGFFSKFNDIIRLVNFNCFYDGLYSD